MITLDTNMYLICSLFNISPSTISKNTGKSLEEIMEIEAENGNTKAANFNKDVLNDPNELVKIFELTDENNRFAILQNLTQYELQQMLPVLEKQDLQLGLKYFTKDKLLTMLTDVPIKDLIKYTNQMFSQDQIIDKLPMDEINKTITSDQVDKNMVLKQLKSCKPQILVQMLEAATGQKANVTGAQEAANQANNNNSDPYTFNVQETQSMSGNTTVMTSNNDLVNQIAVLPQREFNEAIIAMPPVAKRELLSSLVDNDNKILTMFSPQSYVKIISEKEKPEMIKAATALTPQELVKMDSNLSQNLMANLVTQIDPDKFAQILTAQYQEILKKIVAA